MITKYNQNHNHCIQRVMLYPSLSFSLFFFGGGGGDIKKFHAN